jgi:amidase
MAYDGIDDYAAAGAGELAAALASRRVGAVELFEAAVSRIERLDGAINAVVVRDFDRARQAAVAADEALARGESRPLLGVPMTIKEAFNVAGLPTTWGLESARDWIADSDATVVARLKAAGAVIIGKTNVPPNLADWQSANPVYGRTVNPHDHTRSPGGSSGGSAAALASGMVPLEFGSDIGGSIRIPSAFSGVCGHKPSYGLVPPRGHAPPGLDGLPPLLNVVGPMARSVDDLELALSLTAGPEPEEAVGYRLELPAPRCRQLTDFRVLILDVHPLAPVDGEIRSAIAALADRLDNAGAQVSRHSDRLPDLVDAHAGYVRMLLTALSYGAPPGPQAPTFNAWMDMQNHQLATRRRWAAFFEHVDVVVAPVLGMPAFPHMEGEWSERRVMIDGEPRSFGDQLAWVGMATYGNLPATAVPIGVTAGGLPIGVQILGPYLGDRTTLGFARLMQNA